MAFIPVNPSILYIEEALIVQNTDFSKVNILSCDESEKEIYIDKPECAEIRRKYCSPDYLCGTCASFYTCYVIYQNKEAIYNAYKHLEFKDRNTVFHYLLGAGGLIPLRKVLDENHIAVVEDCCIRVNLHKYTHARLRDVEQLSPLRILCDIIELKYVSLLYNADFLEKEINVHKYFPVEDCYQIKFGSFIKSVFA